MTKQDVELNVVEQAAYWIGKDAAAHRLKVIVKSARFVALWQCG